MIGCKGSSPGRRRSLFLHESRRRAGSQNLLNFDLARSALGALRNPDAEHAVLHLRVDPTGLELAAEREAAAIARRTSRVRLRGIRKLHSPFQQQRLAVDV